MSKKSHTFLVQFEGKNSSWCFSYRYWLALHVFSFFILAFLRPWLFFWQFLEFFQDFHLLGYFSPIIHFKWDLKTGSRLFWKLRCPAFIWTPSQLFIFLLSAILLGVSEKKTQNFKNLHEKHTRAFSTLLHDVNRMMPPDDIFWHFLLVWHLTFMNMPFIEWYLLKMLWKMGKLMLRWQKAYSEKWKFGVFFGLTKKI